MNIKKWRAARKMTQQQLADKMEVNRVTVASWERGIKKPSLDNCIKLSEILDVSLDELVKDK